jgi:hypothetical protein
MTFSRSLFSVSFLGALALGVACSSSGGSGGGSSDDACGAYYDAVSGLSNRCDSGFPVNDTRADFLRSCALGVTAPGTSVTPARLQSCASALKGATCSGYISTLFSCFPGGSLPDNSACYDSGQCAGTCVKSAPMGTALNCGKCAPAIPKGGNCEGKESQCATGTFCINKACADFPGQTAPVAVGNVCYTNGDSFESLKSCVDGNYCNITMAVFTTPGATAKCEKTPAKNEACTSTCAKSLSCTNGVCVDQVLLAAGGDCSKPGTKCEPKLTCASGKCVAPAAENAACGFGLMSVPCASPFTCINDKCQLADASLCK